MPADSTSAGPAAVVLLSGGLDSATVLALARAEGRDVHALSFRYGQRHAVELECARRQAALQGVHDHRIIDLAHFGRIVAPASALVADSALAVPRTAPTPDTIPVTYVPARNALFLSYALALAEVLGAREIWIGTNALDYSGYPDCRPAFLRSFERMANLATRAGVEAPEGAPWLRVRAPLTDLRKHEIIARGLALGVDYGATSSCYDPVEGAGRARPCGACESCRLRAEGFARAGVADPALTRT